MTIRSFITKKRAKVQPPTLAETTRERMRRLTAAIESGQPVAPPPSPASFFTSEDLEDELGGTDPKSGQR